MSWSPAGNNVGWVWQSKRGDRVSMWLGWDVVNDDGGYSMWLDDEFEEGQERWCQWGSWPRKYLPQQWSVSGVNSKMAGCSGKHVAFKDSKLWGRTYGDRSYKHHISMCVCLLNMNCLVQADDPETVQVVNGEVPTEISSRQRRRSLGSPGPSTNTSIFQLMLCIKSYALICWTLHLCTKITVF